MSRKKKVSPQALGRTLRIVKPHIPEHKPLMAGGMLALLLEVAFRVLEPWPLKFVVDAVTRSLGADLPGTGPQATPVLLLVCGGALVLITALRALMNYLSTVAFALVGSRVATSLRARVFGHVQSLSDRYHSRARSGDTVQRLVGDVGRLQEVAVTAGLPLLANCITLVAMAGVMFWLDPLLAVVVIAAALAFWFLSKGSSGAITTAARKTRMGEGALANTAQESLGAMRVVQAYRLESLLAGRFKASNSQALTEGVQARKLAAALERRTDVIVGIATALVLVGGGWRVVQGVMSPGDLVVFLTYLKTSLKPLRDLAKYIGRIARAVASGERVADLLDEKIDIRDSDDAGQLPTVVGAVSFHRIRAGYGKDPVLENFSLDIPAGQNICLIGPSGAGKSTVASLLVRMMDPISGCVCIDDYDLRGVAVGSVRSQVSLLLQDSVLFTGTVRENIRFGRLDATDEEVQRAAEMAQAHEFIMATEHGYETVIGERGGTMSGGQRQRLAIARAMLRDAPIVILDEATTGLDPEASTAVMEALERLTEGRTTITITHSASLALKSDRVVWLQDGRIRLDGSPADLLGDDSGVFARWIEQQRAEEIRARRAHDEPGGSAPVPAGEPVR